MAQNKERIQNIAKIISNNTLQINSINIAKINGMCENKYHYQGLNRPLHKCEECGILICSYCIDPKNNKCTACRIDKTQLTIEKKCQGCKRKSVQYFICYCCGKILRICCYCPKFDKYRLLMRDAQNSVIACKKCQ